MERHRFANTDLIVSIIGLGCYGMSGAYGPAVSGKLTIAKELATLTGFSLFHNHLVVDAVAAVFPFGSERFVKLREQFWLANVP